MTELTPLNYRKEVELAKQPVLICVHDSHSGPPKELDDLNSKGIKCCALDVIRYEEMAQNLRILGLPGAILLQDGKIVQRIRGERSLHELTKILGLET